jgi:hypothetical protein
MAITYHDAGKAVLMGTHMDRTRFGGHPA